MKIEEDGWFWAGAMLVILVVVLILGLNHQYRFIEDLIRGF